MTGCRVGHREAFHYDRANGSHGSILRGDTPQHRAGAIAPVTVAAEAAQQVAWCLAWIGASLLLVAGVAKVRRPTATTESLALAGLPDRPVLARLLGAGEVVLAVVVVVTGHQAAAALLALAYVGFTGVSWWLLRTDQGSCGCFGEVDAPLTRVHVATNVVLAAGAGVAALIPAPLPTSPVAVALLAVTIAMGAALLRMLLVLVPALADGIQRLSTS